MSMHKTNVLFAVNSCWCADTDAGPTPDCEVYPGAEYYWMAGQWTDGFGFIWKGRYLNYTTQTIEELPMEYTNWMPLQPQVIQNEENCLMMASDSNYEWALEECETAHLCFVCETEP